MGNLTVEKLEADVNFLINSLDSSKRLIPSPSELLKKTSSIPLIAVALSFFSTVVFYFSSAWNEKTVAGYMHFFGTEGWVVVVPTAIIGLFFILLTYSKVTMYLTLPEDVRTESIILQHLCKVTSRTAFIFIFLMFSDESGNPQPRGFQTVAGHRHDHGADHGVNPLQLPVLLLSHLHSTYLSDVAGRVSSAQPVQ